MDKKRVMKWAVSIFFVSVMGLVFIWLVFGSQGLIHLYRKYKERDAYIERINQLTKENQALRQEIMRLRTDREYMEELVRKELNLVKKNELIFRFAGKGGKNVTTGRPEKKKK